MKISKLPIEEIKKLYENGFTSKQISNKYNISLTTLSKLLKINNLSLRKIKNSKKN